MSAMASQITSVSVIAQPSVQGQIKENIKVPRHWPLWGESTVDRWTPSQRASGTENVSIWWRHNEFPMVHGREWKIISRHCIMGVAHGTSRVAWRPFDSILLWRHNGHDSVSNHQPHDCLLNRLFRRRSKKTSKLRVTGLWAGNSPGTGEFPAPMASNAENVSIWWRHHRI